MKQARQKYPYKDLRLLKPNIDDNIMDLIIELDYLRKKKLAGTTPAPIFFQLKSLFHSLESLGSARIEGNNTTIIDYMDFKSEKKKPKSEKIKEIANVDAALAYIDSISHKRTFKVDEELIKEFHKKVVVNLSIDAEGDQTPGEYRSKGILTINNSDHVPPPPRDVPYYMDELLDFINKQDPHKYDLLKIALTHHRFVWIHPFGNGNGRTVRLITYAQLIKAGFNVGDVGRIVNPTAIFCNNRLDYYRFLSKADTGTDKGLLSWSEYVLHGLAKEIEKVDKLTDYDYLAKKILLPAIDYCLERKFINKTEVDVLKIAIRKMSFQANDLKSVLPGKLPAHISRVINRMKGKNLIVPESENSRKYIISFGDKYILRGIIEMLDRNGFLPIKNEA